MALYLKTSSFQTLIGTVKTCGRTKLEAGQDPVSNPHRYGQNGASHLDKGLPLRGFQTLIGTVKTVLRVLGQIVGKAEFQTLIGTVKTPPQGERSG